MTILITLYSEIRAGDAEYILSLLRKDPGAPVEVRINSPGGLVSEGLAIFNALHPRKPTVYIDGVAASMASVVAMAGARIIAAENAVLMIHNPYGGGPGTASDMRNQAEQLDKWRDGNHRGVAIRRTFAGVLRRLPQHSEGVAHAYRFQYRGSVRQPQARRPSRCERRPREWRPATASGKCA